MTPNAFTAFRSVGKYDIVVKERPRREAMECKKRLKPGMNGTKRYQQRFGDRLLFVRYRHDQERQRRLTTVELIVDEAPLMPPRSEAIKALYPHPNQTVYVRIDYGEKIGRAHV